MKPRSSPKQMPSPQKRLPAHELFPQPGVYRPQSFHQRPQKPRQKQQQPWLWGLVFLSLLVMGFGLFGWLRRPHLQAPYVLVEVRALEEGGHAVSAARLTINDRPMGVTDSFGEWRRYMRLQTGDQLAIDLSKAGVASLQGRKVIRVPPLRSADGGNEVRATIEMRGSRTIARAQTQRPKENRADAETDFYSEETMTRDEGQALNDKAGRPPVRGQAARLPTGQLERQPDEEVPRVDADAPIEDTNDASLGIYFDDGLSTIAVKFKPSRITPANLLEKHQGDILQQKILPLLVTDLQGLGLKVDKSAAWQVSLQYVPKEDQVGYIRAQINWPNPFGQTESTTFIAGFAKTFDETVRALSSLLRVHMKKSYWAFKDNGKWFIDEPSDTKAFWRLRSGFELTDTNGLKFPLQLVSERDNARRWQLDLRQHQPCHNVRQRLRCLVSTQSLKETPPLAGWQKRQMQVQGVLPKDAELFIAGFQATPTSGGRWEYWGHPGSNHKALVLSQGRIIHSEVFVDQMGSPTTLRVMPAAQARQARR